MHRLQHLISRAHSSTTYISLIESPSFLSIQSNQIPKSACMRDQGVVYMIYIYICNCLAIHNKHETHLLYVQPRYILVPR